MTKRNRTASDTILDLTEFLFFVLLLPVVGMYLMAGQNRNARFPGIVLFILGWVLWILLIMKRAVG